MNQHIQTNKQKLLQKHSIKDLIQSMESSVNKILSQSEEGLFELLHQLQNIADIIDNNESKSQRILQQAKRMNKVEEQQTVNQNSDTFFISQIPTSHNEQNLKSTISQQNIAKIDIQTQRLQNETANSLSNNTRLTGKIKIGQLQKKKQQLMKKLKAIDQQLYQSNHKDSLSSSLFKNKSSITNQNSSMVYNKAKKQNTALQHSRTLQILESFNNQKIRRHQQMIQKMKLRQQQEMKKIEQLQTRKIQIQLKRSRYLQDKLVKNKVQSKKQKVKPQQIRG